MEHEKIFSRLTRRTFFTDWRLGFPLLMILIGGILVGISGFRLCSQEWAYHSYKMEHPILVKETQHIDLSHEQTHQDLHRSKLKTFTDLVSYSREFQMGDVLGQLEIPKLKINLPIFEGATSAQLAKGVGHFHESVFPGLKNNCVLSGHRDTVFRHLGELKIGDTLIVKTAAGTFVYTIRKIRIVAHTDVTVIVPTRLPTLTLTTCYPFRFIGNAPKRYVIVAHLQPLKSHIN